MSLAGCFAHLPAARKAEIPREIEAFAAGKLDALKMPALMQDLLECAALVELPYRFTVAAQHCIDRGLCYYHGRMLQ